MAAMKTVRALLLESDDDVAAVLDPVPAGGRVAIVLNASGEVLRELDVRQSVPSGHKLAIRRIGCGDKIRRYGYPIGTALADIADGEHVHTHNMRSLLSPGAKRELPKSSVRPANRVKGLVRNILAAAGAPSDAAEAMADALTEAHLRGVETHGLRRLRPYVARIRSGGVDAKARPQVQGNEAVLMIDGRNGIGHYVGTYAARAVSEVARKHGIALALVRNSNHFGFAGYYATLIARQGQLGIVTSNGQVCVAPQGARTPLLSNNPLAIAAPLPPPYPPIKSGAGSPPHAGEGLGGGGREDALFELDLATSVTSRANIVEAAKSGALLPSGWAQDRDGKATRDPKAALDGSLLAVGGAKGFSFLLALEMMTGVLAGGAYADQVSSKEAAPSAPEGTAHMMIAIDLEQAIGRDDFSYRLRDLLQRLTALSVSEEAAPVRYPGERRWSLRRDRMRDGIPLAAAELDDVLRLAAELGVVIE